MNVRIARWIFGIAGLYGAITMIAMVLHPPAIFGKARFQQPELYYGFASVCFAWQVVFFLIATNPRKYRLLMLIAAVFEKFAFVAVLVVLLAMRRAGLHWVGPAVIDFILGIGFFVAFTSITSQGQP